MAARYSLGKTHVFAWRRDARRSAFAEVLVEDPGAGAVDAADGAIEIELAGARVRIGRADRVLVAARPVDFRKSAEGLAGLVREQMAADPFCGTVYVFRAKRADRIKLIYRDGTGLCLFAKRLEDGGVSLAQDPGRGDAAYVSPARSLAGGARLAASASGEPDP